MIEHINLRYIPSKHSGVTGCFVAQSIAGPCYNENPLYAVEEAYSLFVAWSNRGVTFVPVGYEPTTGIVI